MISTVMTFIIVFGILVFVHESGHFLVAKLNGVYVHEFALGMGPTIFSWQGKETKYALRLLPIGGFVRMEGEDEQSDNPRSFSQKTPLQRLSIIVAGPVMNFILAFIALTIVILAIGMPVNTVGGFSEDSPAMEAGLEVGDRIVQIGDLPIDSWNDVVNAISGTDALQLQITVIRDQEELTYTTNLTEDPETGRKLIGISRGVERNPGKAIQSAFVGIITLIGMILNFLGSLFTGGADMAQVSGPVGIYSAVSQASKAGWISVLEITALLSVNLGLFNLLPIPALDGGRLIFIIVELFRGKPVDPDKEGFVHFVGFVLLMALMVMLVFKDLQAL